MFDLRKCQVDSHQKPIKMMLRKEEKIAQLKEDIANWDEKFLATKVVLEKGALNQSSKNLKASNDPSI